MASEVNCMIDNITTSTEMPISKGNITQNATIQNNNIKTTKDLSTRCNHESCNIKFGLLPFECKCGLKFCGKHRHSYEHNCTYDYKKGNMDMLKKNLVEVKSNKIIKF